MEGSLVPKQENVIHQFGMTIKLYYFFFSDKYHKKLFNCIHNGTLLNLDKIMISFTRKKWTNSTSI